MKNFIHISGSGPGFIKLVAVLLSFVFAAGVAVADYIQPGEVEVKTERYAPPPRDYSTATYHYRVAWQGIPVADAKVDIDRFSVDQKPHYFVRASAETGDFIDVFYRLRHTSESIFSANSFEPVRFASYQKERRKEKLREVSFADGKIVANSEKDGRKNSLEFVSQNPTFDPISAAFIARSLPIDVGKEASFDVFNGKHRYLISFKVDGRDTITVGDEQREAFRVVPTVKKLTDSKGEKRLKSATIWISADDERELLKLESKVLVGRVSATLDRITENVAKKPAVLTTAKK